MPDPIAWIVSASQTIIPGLPLCQVSGLHAGLCLLQHANDPLCRNLLRFISSVFAGSGMVTAVL